ncbi:UNVERIFIED_CONTAM: hypothetical protein K2H54_041350 [Gekko kuhli]
MPFFVSPIIVLFGNTHVVYVPPPPPKDKVKDCQQCRLFQGTKNRFFTHTPTSNSVSGIFPTPSTSVDAHITPFRKAMCPGLKQLGGLNGRGGTLSSNSQG